MSDVNPLLSTRTVEGAAGAVESLLDQGKINKPTTNKLKKQKQTRLFKEKNRGSQTYPGSYRNKN